MKGGDIVQSMLFRPFQSLSVSLRMSQIIPIEVISPPQIVTARGNGDTSPDGDIGHEIPYNAPKTTLIIKLKESHKCGVSPLYVRNMPSARQLIEIILSALYDDCLHDD